MTGWRLVGSIRRLEFGNRGQEESTWYKYYVYFGVVFGTSSQP